MKKTKQHMNLIRFSAVFLIFFLACPPFTFGSEVPAAALPASQVLSDPQTSSDSHASLAAERAISIGLLPASMQQEYTEPITRVDFCAVAVKVYETATGRVLTTRRLYADTEDINAQKMGGIAVVGSAEKNQFLPDEKITREETMLFLSRLMAKMDIPMEMQAADFPDGADISEWAAEAVGLMQAMGVADIAGENDDGCFSPQSYSTREQVIEELLQVYDLGAAVKLEQIVEILEEDVPLGKFELSDKEAKLRQYAGIIIEMVNAERAKAGLEPLICTDILHAAATKRARELEERFAHDRPDGRYFITIFDDLGINYRLRGENLAKFFRSSEECVEGWMKSDAHRHNILFPQYKKAGVGVHQDSSGRLYWAMIYSD